MDADDIAKFKELFSKYCRQEINAGHCADDSCEFCPINRAYAEIFDCTDCEEYLTEDPF